LEPDGGGEKAGHYLPGTALSVEKAGAGLTTTATLFETVFAIVITTIRVVD